jgi:hypothetical protein
MLRRIVAKPALDRGSVSAPSSRLLRIFPGPKVVTVDLAYDVQLYAKLDPSHLQGLLLSYADGSFCPDTDIRPQ